MDYIASVLEWLIENILWPIQQAIKPIIFVLGQLIATLFDGFLTVVLTILSALDVGTIATRAAAGWGLLDVNVAWILVSSGVTTGLSIIGVSFMVRFSLNLIPAEFTRI